MESCLPYPEILTGYQSLLDATVFHVVWRQIDPEPQHHPIPLNDVDELMLGAARAKNFDGVVKNLKQLYEEELGQTLLIVPDCSVLGHAPGKLSASFCVECISKWITMCRVSSGS